MSKTALTDQVESPTQEMMKERIDQGPFHSASAKREALFDGAIHLAYEYVPMEVRNRMDTLFSEFCKVN